MTAASSLLVEIQCEFQRTAAAFLDQLRRIEPQETPYALLFEIADQTPGAWPIGATEESLSRGAETHIANGYKAPRGNDLDLLRVLLRWDAPGDDMRIWYWGEGGVDDRLNQLINAAWDSEVIDDHRVLEDLCLAALAELNADGTFGCGEQREQLVVGITNVDFDFASFLSRLCLVNPPSVIHRLRGELEAADRAHDQIIRPGDRKPV